MGVLALMLLKMYMAVFWVVTLCAVTGRFQHFGGTC
jgi:hypothetical protein